MPQILKDDVRERIVESAKQEFLEKSYEHSSMRSNAVKSHMTVGNLYRYFSSKEELNRYIVGPTLERINGLIMKLTGNQITLEMMNSMELTVAQLSGVLDSLGEGLVDIYKSHRTEVNILMMHSSVNEALVNWFAQAIMQLVSRNLGSERDSEYLTLLSHSYAVSIFEGIKYMLKESKLSEQQLKQTVKIYMRSYVNMLENELQKQEAA